MAKRKNSGFHGHGNTSKLTRKKRGLCPEEIDVRIEIAENSHPYR
ncbi:MAG: hypothetical protein AAF798_09260 [Bacteroidota bacterium]